MVTHLRVGVSSQDVARNDMVLNLPAYSPVTHGQLQLDLTVTDGLIATATPILGSMHRGAEKLFESRDYRQILSLANRHEWTSAITGEIGIAQLIENELGIVLPESAAWHRTLLIEIQRICSHLAFLAGFAWVEESFAFQLRSLRESWVQHLQQFTGGRMHPMVTVFGGISHEPTREWLMRLQQLTHASDQELSKVDETFHSLLQDIPTGLGKLSIDDVTQYSLSGPVARASGWATDLRSQSPALRYAQTQSFTIHSQTSGDVIARLTELFAEVATSHKVIMECVEHCLDLSGQPVNVLLPKVIRVPEGQYTSAIETPLGIAMWFLESRGDKYPYRLKLRPASLHTILSLSSALVGSTLDQVPLIVGSMPFICGDADR